MEGIGIFWCLTEMLHEEDGYLDTDYENIAYELGCDANQIESLINDFGLFETDGEKFWSESVLKRLNIRNDRSAKASASANVRWRNATQNANAMRTHNDTYANIEENSIVKNKREEDSKYSVCDFDFSFAENSFKRTLQAWITYKSTSKKPFRNQMEVEAAYKELLELSNHDAVTAEKILNQSIANGYVSLLALKSVNNAPARVDPRHLPTSEEHLMEKLQ